jgi:hypothetical protein
VKYQPRFGLGNIVQTIPAIRFLESQGDDVTLIATDWTAPFLEAVFGRRYQIDRTPGQRPYCRTACPEDFNKQTGISEVVKNLQIAGAEATNEQREPHWPMPISYPVPAVDIVICDGYSKRASPEAWLVKSYPFWAKVVEALPGRMIASVGLPGEEVPGTVNMTNIGLGPTLDLIRKCRLFVSNDTGLYHAAAAMQIPTIAIFTATDTVKNHDPVFHRTATILRRDLPCSPCQHTAHHYWITNRKACGWACRYLQPADVAAAIEAKL